MIVKYFYLTIVIRFIKNLGEEVESKLILKFFIKESEFFSFDIFLLVPILNK